MQGKQQSKSERFWVVDLDRIIPEDHILKKIDKIIDLIFIRKITQPYYCPNNGRPSIDPEVFFRMLIIGYLYGLAINFKIIGAHERESHYVFDMLFNNNTNLAPDWISGDMHLINRVNFALLDFRDIEFMPCYRSVPRETKNLCGFKDLHYYKKYLIKPSRKINWQLIIDEWPNIQNIIAALMMKETTQHIIIKNYVSIK